MNSLSILFDRDYLLDLQELSRHFREVDPTDPDTLRFWFAGHPYLATNDHARIASVCLKTVQRWRRAVGMPPGGVDLPAGDAPGRF